MRLRAALLMPAIAAFGLGTAPLVTAAISVAPASSAVGSCIVNPFNDGGCLPVPCPQKPVPFTCIESTGTTAVAAKV